MYSRLVYVCSVIICMCPSHIFRENIFVAIMQSWLKKQICVDRSLFLKLKCFSDCSDTESKLSGPLNTKQPGGQRADLILLDTDPQSASLASDLQLISTDWVGKHPPMLLSTTKSSNFYQLFCCLAEFCCKSKHINKKLMMHIIFNVLIRGEEHFFSTLNNLTHTPRAYLLNWLLLHRQL